MGCFRDSTDSRVGGLELGAHVLEGSLAVAEELWIHESGGPDLYCNGARFKASTT